MEHRERGSAGSPARRPSPIAAIAVAAAGPVVCGSEREQPSNPTVGPAIDGRG